MVDDIDDITDIDIDSIKNIEIDNWWDWCCIDGDDIGAINDIGDIGGNDRSMVGAYVLMIWKIVTIYDIGIDYIDDIEDIDVDDIDDLYWWHWWYWWYWWY